MSQLLNLLIPCFELLHCINWGIITISPFWTLLSQNLNDCLVFPFLVFAIYGNIFLLKYSGYFVWDLHTLLDRGNLCHSDVWYILCCLLRVFVLSVTWDFCTALLVPCTSKSVCLPYLQAFLFGFGICTLCLFCSCYILLLFSVFNLSFFSSAFVWF